METSKTWKNSENLMYVVGATKAEYFTEIRKVVPDSFLLVPEVAQGGSLYEAGWMLGIIHGGMLQAVLCRKEQAARWHGYGALMSINF
jgi:hypothetical protein